MIYIIIGLVLLLIAAPIIAVLPSKRQKEQMKLRQQAMAQGISVELTSIDDPIPEQKKYITGTGKQLKADPAGCRISDCQAARPGLAT